MQTKRQLLIGQLSENLDVRLEALSIMTDAKRQADPIMHKDAREVYEDACKQGNRIRAALHSL